MDEKSDFLNGFVQEEIYLGQPPGYVKKCEEDKVYNLNIRHYMD